MTRGQPSDQESDNQSKILYELSALVMNIMRHPPSQVGFAADHAAGIHQRRRGASTSFEQITPAGFASLLLGISLALMLCGSVTFFIGFMLMPWVIGLVMFLYCVGIISIVSMIGRAILFQNSASPSSSKDVPSWKLL